MKYSSGKGFSIFFVISSENLTFKTFNALNITLGIRGDRTVELVRWRCTVDCSLLKSVGGFRVRIPTYSKAENASVDKSIALKRLRMTSSGARLLS